MIGKPGERKKVQYYPGIMRIRVVDIDDCAPGWRILAEGYQESTSVSIANYCKYLLNLKNSKRITYEDFTEKLENIRKLVESNWQQRHDYIIDYSILEQGNIFN